MSTATPTCSSVFSSATLACSFDLTTRTLTVEGMFPTSNADGQYGIVVQGVENGANSLTTDSFSLTLYSSNNYEIVVDSDGITTVIYDPISPCGSTCLTCAGTATTCTSCIVPSNEPFYNPVTHTCTASCPLGTFPLDYVCYPCYDTCATCYDYKASTCVTCDPGYVFENGYCIASGQCGQGATETSGSCQNTSPCTDPACVTCSTSTSFCLVCNETSATPIADIATGKCVDDTVVACSTHFYLNNVTKKCELCDWSCADCELSATECFDCWDSMSNNTLNWLDYTCILPDTCPDGTYYDTTVNECPLCNYVCKTCTAGDPNTCTSCNKTE